MATAASVQAVLPEANYVAGEALVRFQAAETLASAKQVAARHGLTLERHFAGLSIHEGQVIGLLHSPGLTTGALLEELQSEPAIASAEPNFIRRPCGGIPNDPRFGQLWALQNTGQIINGLAGTSGSDIKFSEAWRLARPSTNQIVVAVIDSGVDYIHPDLAANMWTNPGEVPNNAADDDGNGYTDDYYGYNFADGNSNPTAAGVHGTHVAGTIAAAGNNQLGVIGVDYQAKIMALRVASDADPSSFPDAAIISALDYAVMMKGRGVNLVAINASWGGSGSDSVMRSAIQAAGDAGIIFCAAAGNSAINNDVTPFYPASDRLPNMIVVAASDQNDTLASFSNYGAGTVDLAAPGVNILSCVPSSQPGYSTYVRQANNVFTADALTYSGVTSTNGITGTMYYCGLGYPTNFPAAVSNNIALILRGTLQFSEKVSNAMTAGARAAVIYNNTNGSFLGTLQSAGSWVPALSLSQADGLALKAALPAIVTVANAIDPAMVYDYLDGTSMATPHVSGAVAFAAQNFPSESVAQRIQRVLTNATPVAALAGKTRTGARLNLTRIVDSDNNGLSDWWELQYFNHLTGTNPNADADADGASNLAEFLAGTNPTNTASALRLTAQSPADGIHLTLQWPSVADRHYRLLRSTNLAGGFDTIVQTNLPATPPLNTFTDALPVGTKNAFYRLQLEP
ncbi:MAG: S8 family serine peptidase [Verrucomicrobiota bacterium]